MDNWNYDKALDYMDGIKHPISRCLTKLFFEELVHLVTQKKEAYPDSEFDLLFFVKVVSEVTRQPELLRRALVRGDQEEGWEAIDELMRGEQKRPEGPKGPR